MSILCSCVASSLPPGFELRVIENKLVELKKNLKNLEKEIFQMNSSYQSQITLGIMVTVQVTND